MITTMWLLELIPYFQALEKIPNWSIIGYAKKAMQSGKGGA